MSTLRLLTKVAFIFNVCFLIATGMGFTQWMPAAEISSLVIVAGYILAVFTSALVTIWILVCWFLYKSLPKHIPRWLIVVNFLFLIAEIIFFSR